MAQNTLRMTQGPIAAQMVRFAGPIFLGNLFQQLYNMVDSLIVGNFAGDDALAAVASSGNLIFLFVGFLFGLFGGAGVIIAKYFGAEDVDRVKRAIHTTVALAIACGIFITLLGIFLSPLILQVMGTPASVISNSTYYFQLYFSGGIAICLYNAAAGIFQAVGDSKHPVYYLVISSVINVVLDLLFVGAFQMGVGGAAIATVISQVVSAVLAFYKLMHTQEIYRVEVRRIRIERGFLREILAMGIPTGVQNSVIGFANTVVQANINGFGELAVAGCGSYAKIEGFAFLPITSFSMALTTFISQNLGAGEKKRVKKGAAFGVLSAVGLAELIGLIVYLFMPIFMGFFTGNPAIIEIGARQAHIESLFYCLLACSHAMAGVLRGQGKSVVPMVVMLAVWCVLRVTYITIALHISHTIDLIFWAYPLTWCISTIIFSFYLYCNRQIR